MRIDIQTGLFNFHFELARMVKATGISSQVRDTNKHILMWDFDSAPLLQVTKALRDVQHAYRLPTIHLLETGEDNYHAYCFREETFEDAIEIVSHTSLVDRTWVNLSLARGHFVLRITTKHNRNIRKVKTLSSIIPIYLDDSALTHTERYWTY